MPYPPRTCEHTDACRSRPAGGGAWGLSERYRTFRRNPGFREIPIGVKRYFGEARGGWMGVRSSCPGIEQKAAGHCCPAASTYRP